MTWSFDSNSPVSLQIASILRQKILMGEFKPGELFPTVRQLACDAYVNPNTVQKSLSILESEGLLITKSTSGRYVTSDENAIKSALASLQDKYIERVLTEGASLGITREKFIEILSKEENKL